MEDVPQWVLDGGSYTAAIRRLAADPSLCTTSGHAPLQAEVRRSREAAQRWCAERGLSYVMTVLGGARPSPSEQLAGYTTGAGPKHEHTQAYLREHRR